MADSHDEATASRTVVRRIARKRLSAKSVLFVEALLPRLLWPASIIFLFLTAAWSGLFYSLPPIAARILLAAFIFAVLYSLKGLLKLRWPANVAADQRLETANHLSHQAISALSDKPAVESPAANALWRAHQKRLAAKIKSLDAGTPAPGISRYDPYGLRALPVLAVVIAFSFSYSNRGGRLSDAFLIRAEETPNIELRADAWVTPPAYTKKAPIFLTAGEYSSEPRIVPEGSLLTVRLSGGPYRQGEITFTSASNGTTVELKHEETEPADRHASAPETENRTYLTKLASDGTLTVNGKRWQFKILKDQSPKIEFDKEPGRAVNGALEIGFVASDDYGVQNARAIIEPADPEEMAYPLYPLPEYPLNLPQRNGREVKGVTSRNLTEHPLSGKRVRITLVAEDNAGNEGRSKTKEIILPAKNFSKPLAAAAAEERQVFSLNQMNLGRAIKLNKALFLRADETISNLTHFLLLSSAGQRMKIANSQEDLKDTADYLWEIALGIEDGDLSLAERRLRDAQTALADALERDASDAEIEKLMHELRDALNNYMEELAKQLQQNPDARTQQENTANLLRQQDLQRMLDQIQNLAQSGAKEEARNLLSEMQRMLNNLQTAQRQSGQPNNSQMREQIDKLGELLQKQKSLMDQTYEMEQTLRDRMQRGDPQEGEDGDLSEQQSQNGSKLDNMTADELREALKQLKKQQQALGEQLGQVQEGLRKQGVKPLPGFSEAGKEMGQAADALGKGQGGRAVGSQGRAIEALRKGASELMQQLTQNGQRNGQGQALNQPGKRGYDPLGRPLKSSGPDFGENVKLPEEIDIQRAREILDAIRRKLGENLSPDIERQYLERLLDIK